MDNSTFLDPSALTPLFVAERTVCAYPISDFYATSPRYLYYALLFLCFVTHWTGWLANVFLGGAAAYAGVAAIEAIILRVNHHQPGPIYNVTIPLVSTPLNATFQALSALVVDTDHVPVQPAVLELDIDAILAIVVTGYLVVLPMQCWSRVVKLNRARRLLMATWNVLMLAGTVCALTLWPSLRKQPPQYKFCYPNFPDPSPIGNDGWPPNIMQGSWNDTVWTLFGNLTLQAQLSTNCFYPCFNTSSIMRDPDSLKATDYDPVTSPRTGFGNTGYNSTLYDILPKLIYLAVGLSAAAVIYILIISQFSKATRVPAGEPHALWARRKEIRRQLWSEFKMGCHAILDFIHGPRRAYRRLAEDTHRGRTTKFLRYCRFWTDILTLIVLLVSLILSPITMVTFLFWIEWYIAHDGKPAESARQVGQWSSSVSIALVLVSAAIYRLKYVIASRADIQREIDEMQVHLRELEAMVEKKVEKERVASWTSTEQGIEEEMEVMSFGK